MHIIRNRPWNRLLRLLGGYRPLPLDPRYAYKGTPSALADATELLTHLLAARLGYLHIRGASAKLELLGLPEQRQHVDLILRALDKHFRCL